MPQWAGFVRTKCQQEQTMPSETEILKPMLMVTVKVLAVTVKVKGNTNSDTERTLVEAF